ncbi:MAG: nucleoside 2-deoxyribosyltransferase [Candidatus Aenigmatarchaeota archaeon]|nr:nucleoside 2-deoxyribosyltransferase [Candidatus Aenigmarchaeota archaeon]
MNASSSRSKYDQDLPKLYSSRRNADVNDEIESLLTASGFEVLRPSKLTPQNAAPALIFKSNIELIRQADVMVAVLRGYGKDTAAEVGIAYGMGIPVVGVDFDADPKDVMIYNALTEIVKIEQLPHVLSKIVAHLRQDRDGTRDIPNMHEQSPEGTSGIPRQDPLKPCSS